MRRSLLAVPAVLLLALSGCVLTPPAVPEPEPIASPSSPIPSTDPIDPPSPAPSVAPSTSPEDDLAPDENIAPIDQGGDRGSAGNPYGVGEELTGEGWAVTLAATDTDANDAATAGFGQRAPGGYQWVATPVRVSQEDEGSSTYDVFASFVASNGDVYYRTYLFADDANPWESMTPGQAYEFRDYMLVPEDAIDGGVIAITTGDLTSFVETS